MRIAFCCTKNITQNITDFLFFAKDKEWLWCAITIGSAKEEIAITPLKEENNHLAYLGINSSLSSGKAT